MPAPLGKGGFAAEGLVEALAVEHAGEGVVADEFAGLFELGLQAGDLGVGVVGLVAEFFDLAAGALGVIPASARVSRITSAITSVSSEMSRAAAMRPADSSIRAW